ncbi:MAG: hypothetical protein IPM20_03040 [Gammaproteobacteria bacterium]|nr:hypothetical protein [Gammaproteobacteria bacterium]
MQAIVERNIRTIADVDHARIRMSLELGAEADEIARDSRRTAGRHLASLRDQLTDEQAWRAALEGMGLDQRTAMLLIEGAAGGRICRRVQTREGC